MTSEIDDISARRNLDAELRELGTALRAAPVPPADERALRSAFRARRFARPVARPGFRWRRVPLIASAAALVVSVVTAGSCCSHRPAATSRPRTSHNPRRPQSRRFLARFNLCCTRPVSHRRAHTASFACGFRSRHSRRAQVPSSMA